MKRALQAIQERNQAAAAAGIGSTPTFIVNGDRLEAIRDSEGALVYGRSMAKSWPTTRVPFRPRLKARLSANHCFTTKLAPKVALGWRR
jgi:hypothetical protein